MDRNIKEDVSYNIKETSLSARRAWIEIGLSCLDSVSYQVALRKESVDRNTLGFGLIVFQVWSLSARRAWIEITAHTARNTSIAGRSPQGERG